MRLFIAIDIPDDLKKKIGSLRSDIPGARWVPAEQLHLSLAFLGEVEETTIERLSGELARIKQAEFKLCFSGTGCFPDLHRPRVLWVRPEPQPYLQVLAEKVREAVLFCGIPQEERRFSPHLTLARMKQPPSREFNAFIEQNKLLKYPPFSVREFSLFQSRLSQQGAVHIPLRNFPLTTVGGGSSR